MAAGHDRAPRERRWRRRLVDLALATAGAALFAYLVHATGVSLEALRAFGGHGLALLMLASFGVILLDTFAWYFAVRHVARPRLLSLLGLRIAGDGLTNGLPGGVVIGETYKAVMLRRWYGISLADNAATLLMIKFGLGLSQAVFVLTGLSLCYRPLDARSRELFGFDGAQYISLTLTIGMGLFMLFPLALMLRGHSFATGARLLAKLPIRRLRRWLDQRAEGIAALDASCTRALHDNRRHLLLTFSFLLGGWLVSSLESWVLLTFLGLAPALRTAYVIESVGSMFRLIFFMVPSGIGGQDASFIALFRLYRLPVPEAGAFILLKRFKEALWIGLGFVLVPIFRRRVLSGATEAPEPILAVGSTEDPPS